MLKLLWALTAVAIVSVVLLFETSGITEANNTDLLRGLATLDSQISTLETTVSDLQQKVRSIDENYAKADHKDR